MGLRSTRQSVRGKEMGQVATFQRNASSDCRLRKKTTIRQASGVAGRLPRGPFQGHHGQPTTDLRKAIEADPVHLSIAEPPPVFVSPPAGKGARKKVEMPFAHLKLLLSGETPCETR